MQVENKVFIIKGDKRNPEPIHHTIIFPSGHIGVVRTTDNNYWAHTYVNTDKTNPTFNEATTQAYFEALLNPVTLAITDVTETTIPVITVASTAELRTGMNVTFKNIVWTVDPTSGDTLNDSSFTIEVINATTFKITAGVGSPVPTFDTTGGTYGSGGTIQMYYE